MLSAGLSCNAEAKFGATPLSRKILIVEDDASTAAYLAKGLAEYRLDRLDSAIAILRGEASKALGPCPRLILSMAEFRLGHKVAARQTLASAVGSFQWREAQAYDRETWICFILRREAESLIGSEEVPGHDKN